MGSLVGWRWGKQEEGKEGEQRLVCKMRKDCLKKIKKEWNNSKKKRNQSIFKILLWCQIWGHISSSPPWVETCSHFFKHLEHSEFKFFHESFSALHFPPFPSYLGIKDTSSFSREVSLAFGSMIFLTPSWIYTWMNEWTWSKLISICGDKSEAPWFAN